MRIAVTADLHYGKSRAESAATEVLADRVIRREPDAIIIAGDVAVADPRALVACLRLFLDSAAHKLVIPGNHDLWSRHSAASAGSQVIWERLFTRSSELGGFHRLDREPVVIPDGEHRSVGFVGSVGWYDYSMADAGLDAPTDWYRLKVLPDEEGKAVTVWNDVRFIRWSHTDEGFVRLLVQELRDHLTRVRDRSNHIVAVTHHLPFAELLPSADSLDAGDRAGRFRRAFMGARAIGETLRSEPKVRLSVCGHSHERGSADIGHLRAVNVGSNEVTKRALFFETEPGARSDVVFREVEPEEAGV